MSTRVTVFGIVKAISLLSLMAAISINSNAQTLGISSDQVTVTVPGTSFSSTATLANTGTVSAVTGVPTTGTLTTPTFSFAMQQTGAASTSGTYSVGIVLDEQGSQRRLEVFIPTVTFTFDGSGNLTGALGAQNVKIYGRDATGATQVEASVASAGSVAFSGTTLSFSAADQIALIQAQGGILADITTAINNTGLTYDYTIILARTAGTNYTFQHSDTTAFPAASTEFVIGAGDNAVLDVASQKLSGTVTFAAPGGGGGGGGGGETATLTDEQIGAQIAALPDLTNPSNVTPEVLAQVATLVADAGTNASELAAQLAIGSATPTQGLAALTTLNSVLNVTSQLVAAGTVQTTTTLTTAISNMASVFSTLAAAGPLSASQIATVQSLADSAVTNITANVGPTNTKADSKALATALSSMLQGVRKSGGKITPALATTTKKASDALADSSAAAILAQFFPTVPSGGGAAQLATSGKGRSALLSLTPSLFLKPTAPSLTFQQISVDLAALLGIELTSITTSSLTRVLDTSKTLEEIIEQAAGTGVSADLSSTTNQVNLTLDSSLFHTELIGSHIVPDVMPEGASLLADGTILIVSDELGFNVAPGPRDFAALQTAMTSAFSATILTNQGTGSYLLETADAKVSLTFAFEDITPTVGNGSGAVAFGGLVGSPADADYKLTVTFADGATQSMLPFVADSNFLDSLELAGFLAEIDRSTGIISFDNGARFKPDFLVRTPTASEQTFLDNNLGDANGISFSNQGDVNGDGLADVKILSATGVQTLYSLP